VRRLERFIPALTTFAFALVVAQPLFVRMMTCSDDGFFHLAKAVSLEQLIHSGHFFGRWSPVMAHGFGYPYFNYYGPLPSYLLIGLHSLGFIYPTALHLSLFLCIWLTGLATYALVREWWGSAAGAAAAIVYMTAPYLAFDVMVRGALAETFALIWPPIILYTLRRALTPPRPVHHALLSTLAFAALLYAHNATALAVAPLVGGDVVLLALQQRSGRTLLRGGVILALGLAVSARFWLPALAERNLVQSDRLLVPPIFTYYTNFLSLRELLALPLAIDPLLINPSPAKGLGLLTFVVALIGFAALVARAISARRSAPINSSTPDYGWRTADFLPAAFFLLALLAYMLLTLPVSRPVWEMIPLLPFIQFPWRFLGAAALCAAVLGGAAVSWLPKRQWLLATALALGLTLANWSWWSARYCGAFAEVDLARTLSYELATDTLGTTAKGEFLPITVKAVPSDRTIVQALIDGQRPQYLTGLPAGAHVAVTSVDVLDYRATLTTPASFTLTFNQFYFPGWRAALDGQPAAIKLTPATGLMTVAIPAGTHLLRFHFGDTPIRAIGDSLSLAALVGLAAASAWHAVRRGTMRPVPASSLRPAAHSSFVILALGLALALARFTLLDRTDSPLRRSAFDGASVRTAQHAFQADFEGGVRAYGYDLSATTLPADGFVDVALYVSVREHVSRQFWPAFSLKDAAGLTGNDPNALPPRWHKEPPDTQYWDPDSYAQWARHLTLFPGTPPGQYQLWGEVFDKQSKHIASLLDETGLAVAPRFSLGTLTVTRPARPFALTPEIRAPHAFGPLALLGYNLNRTAANAGESVIVTLYWKSEAATRTDFIARAGLLSPDGLAALSVDLPPVAGYPTSAWQPGDQWRGQHRLQLPATFKPGFYQLLIAVGGETMRLGQIKVFAPPHDFARPELQFESGAAFEGVGVLEGYSLDRRAGTLAVTLVWRAADSPGLGYSAFVHLQDEAGRVWAQSDSVPADWTRPTTGWVAGEYITDTHRLALPADLRPGRYHLFAGLYDPETARRVPALGPGAAADNRVEIGALTLP